MLVERRICVDVLPGDHGDQIEIEPPDQEHGEVEQSQARSSIVLLSVWLYGEGSNHGHEVQEEHDVPAERGWHVTAQKNFEIAPQDLIRQPEGKPCHEQHPEKASAAMTGESDR